MGMFSWFSSDEKRRIVAGKTKNITMLGPDGRCFVQEEEYEGYGVFGGKDIYEYVAELNGLGSDRLAGINLIAEDDPSVSFVKAKQRGIKVPVLLTDTTFRGVFESYDPPLNDPDQGFDIAGYPVFYGDSYEEEDDEDDYDYDCCGYSCRDCY